MPIAMARNPWRRSRVRTDAAFVVVDNFSDAMSRGFKFSAALNIMKDEDVIGGAPAVGFGFGLLDGVDIVGGIAHSGIMSSDLAVLRRPTGCRPWARCMRDNSTFILISGNAPPGTSGGPNFNCCRCVVR